MPGHLPAPVIGQGFAHGASYCLELAAECPQYMRCRSRMGMRQLDQQHQTRGAPGQGADGTGVVGALDEVLLPVACKLAIVHFWQAHVDAQLLFGIQVSILMGVALQI